MRIACLMTALLAESTQAALFKGDALDQVAEIVSWVALIVAPIVLIGVFWMVHILPEKIAEKRKHPQAKAIQTLCLLSLFFGGILWPLAWLWAYSKPVLHKMAYGTDEAEHDEPPRDRESVAPGTSSSELQRLRMTMRPAEREAIESPVEAHASRERG